MRMTYGQTGDVQFPARRHARLALLVSLTATLAAAGAADLGADPVFATAWLVVAAWVAAEWGRNAWAWLYSATAMACHLAVAMGMAHGWSHAHAYAHTAEVSGFGPGLYVSYAVVALWVFDAVAGGCGLPWRRLHTATRASVAFVMFNATVVYGTWSGKLLGVAAFGTLFAVWWRGRQPGLPSGSSSRAS